MVEMNTTFIFDLFIILTIAILTPMIANWSPKFKIPTLVLEIIIGIIIGPYVLGLVKPDPGITALSVLGVSFLFFIAGLQINIDKIKGKPLNYALLGWILSLIIALIIGGLLQLSNIVISFIFVALALSTTSLGVLVPVLKDSGDLNSNFGRYIFAAGTIAEFIPLIILAIFFNPDYNKFNSIILFALYIIFALIILVTVNRWKPKFITKLMRETMHNSGQFAIRTSFLLIVALTVLSVTSGIHFVFGAFIAGIIVSEIIKKYENDRDVEDLRTKFDGIGFGFIIPIFFIVTGINFDLADFLGNPSTLIMVPLFLICFLIIRGAPAFVVYRKALSQADKLPFALFSATQLPLVIVITDLAVKSGSMHPDIAANLVGAAIISVIIFPLIALSLRRNRLNKQVS
jgi:Kef-type K+ transport system membrane component KefB